MAKTKKVEQALKNIADATIMHWLRRARQELGLSTVKMGALLGVSCRTIENWEQGRPALKPAILLLEKIMTSRKAIAKAKGRV